MNAHNTRIKMNYYSDKFCMADIQVDGGFGAARLTADLLCCLRKHFRGKRHQAVEGTALGTLCCLTFLELNCCTSSNSSASPMTLTITRRNGWREAVLNCTHHVMLNIIHVENAYVVNCSLDVKCDAKDKRKAILIIQ